MPTCPVFTRAKIKSRFGILVIFPSHKAVVLMVSIISLISSSSSLFSRYLGTVPRASTTIGTTVTFMFGCYFSTLAKSMYFSTFSPSFTFTPSSAETKRSTRWQVLFFVFINTGSGLLVGIRWSIWISKFQRIVCVLFSRTASGLCTYHLLVCWNSSFLHDSQWITFPPCRH